jgi:hypothetical protein
MEFDQFDNWTFLDITLDHGQINQPELIADKVKKRVVQIKLKKLSKTEPTVHNCNYGFKKFGDFAMAAFPLRRMAQLSRTN